jgi:hypothetical protein
LVTPYSANLVREGDGEGEGEGERGNLSLEDLASPWVGVYLGRLGAGGPAGVWAVVGGRGCLRRRWGVDRAAVWDLWGVGVQEDPGEGPLEGLLPCSRCHAGGCRLQQMDQCRIVLILQAFLLFIILLERGCDGQLSWVGFESSVH